MVTAESILERFWGPPERKASFGRKNEAFGLFRWSVQAAEGSPVLIYAAFNRADLEAPSATVAVFGSDVDEIAIELTWTHREVEQAESITAGDTLDLEAPLWPGCNMHIFFLCDLLPSTVALLALANRQADPPGLSLLQVIPIYGSEVALKNALGSDKFSDLLDRSPYLDTLRAPLSAPRDPH